jgi:hypothetical protein
MPKGLPRAVKNALEKSREAAILALEVYNKPATKFKSGGYIVLMVIAWTSLFHAIFMKRKQKPFYKEKGRNRYVKRDGDYSYWELSTCVVKYFADANSPIRKNLEFFIPLRNKIEHKSFPELDADIFAECQSLLLNYDRIVCQEFGESYCIKESLSFALQLFPSSANIISTVKHSKDYKSITDFITEYRSAISVDVLNSGEYSFKAFLIQVANHESKDALPVQFINWSNLTDVEKQGVTRVAALIKDKLVHVTNKDCVKPGAIVKEVQEALGNPKVRRQNKDIDRFNHSTLQRCLKKYHIRDGFNTDHPEITDNRYCLYDQVNDNYVYKPAFAQFLLDKLRNEDEWQGL